MSDNNDFEHDHDEFNRDSKNDKNEPKQRPDMDNEDNSDSKTSSIVSDFQKSYSKIDNRTKKGVLIGAIAVLLLGSIICVSYKVGYDKGHDNGLETGKKEASSKSDKLSDILKGSNSPFKFDSGVLQEVKKDSVIIDTSDGERKTVKLNDKTKITKKTDTLSVSDLKKGQKVTIYNDGNQDNPTATRIVLRD